MLMPVLTTPSKILLSLTRWFDGKRRAGRNTSSQDIIPESGSATREFIRSLNLKAIPSKTASSGRTF